jgi:hypothetical protein
VVLTILKKIVNGKDYPLYEMENKNHVPNMFQTTNQLSHDIPMLNLKPISMWHFGITRDPSMKDGPHLMRSETTWKKQGAGVAE